VLQSAWIGVAKCLLGSDRDTVLNSFGGILNIALLGQGHIILPLPELACCMTLVSKADFTAVYDMRGITAQRFFRSSAAARGTVVQHRGFVWTQRAFAAATVCGAHAAELRNMR
jgi:hypothetical protein